MEQEVQRYFRAKAELSASESSYCLDFEPVQVSFYLPLPSLRSSLVFLK